MKLKCRTCSKSFSPRMASKTKVSTITPKGMAANWGYCPKCATKEYYWIKK